MRRLLALLLLALPLSACFDADVTVDFKDTQTVEVASSHSMTRQLFDMSGKSPEDSCPDGQGTLTVDSFTCRSSKTLTLDEFIAGAAKGADRPEAQLREAVKVERLGDTRLRLSFDPSGAMAEKPEAQEMKAMAGLMRAALAGHSIVLRIRAPKIEDTTGTLSPDGKQAEHVLPLTALLDGPAPAPFVTTVELKSCKLWVFC